MNLCCLRNFLAILVAVISCMGCSNAADVDPELVGLWELQLPNGHWEFEISADARYAFRSFTIPNAPDHSGEFFAAEGKWQLKSTTMDYTDAGTYQVQNGTLLFVGQFGPAQWRRSVSSATPASVPSSAAVTQGPTSIESAMASIDAWAGGTPTVPDHTSCLVTTEEIQSLLGLSVGETRSFKHEPDPSAPAIATRPHYTCTYYRNADRSSTVEIDFLGPYTYPQLATESRKVGPLGAPDHRFREAWKHTRDSQHLGHIAITGLGDHAYWDRWGDDPTFSVEGLLGDSSLSVKWTGSKRYATGPTEADVPKLVQLFGMIRSRLTPEPGGGVMEVSLGRTPSLPGSGICLLTSEEIKKHLPTVVATPSVINENTCRYGGGYRKNRLDITYHTNYDGRDARESWNAKSVQVMRMPQTGKINGLGDDAYWGFGRPYDLVVEVLVGEHILSLTWFTVGETSETRGIGPKEEVVPKMIELARIAVSRLE